ncbi:hypothetical protein PtrV1_12434 [Pyrenophora tritici-repentis]|uniref:Uncharacterized protein n=1 Tax=Pyrenophora tritici-repentis TaxID=45151 RepID=A0A316ZUC9_9PLEO|nr:hypothetical protein PtrV1_12434 [Pyrenophora tritici-repentis]KAF7445238.1 hypothetical protein A1F99_102240 [Pyrenophora tritici-repentis]KAI0613119.1 hypothetical protein TUN205_02612 [Pyrenophora tritici-repentis]KAI1512563.1 hypothetical protein Ptr86124_008529 [Pyrenophora tritici-repentis]KAI1677805.1 hypothetical protein KJE20_12741 [Pyrenophora tritici-repentis]
MAVDFDCKDTTENDEQSPNASRHTGPATMSVNLSYACSQCNYVAKKKFELNKHVNQRHNHRLKCVHQGCGNTFGLRANLERHERIHRKNMI